MTAGPRDREHGATIAIDALRESDVLRCAQLERMLFPDDDPWTERAFRDELRAGHRYLAARVRPPGPGPGDRPGPGAGNGPDAGGELVGYGGLAFVAGPPRAEAEVHTIGVDPSYQGRGVGRALLRGLLDVADAAGAVVFLEVRTDNAAARTLYETEGFLVVGLRRRYYSPSGADAHTMRRDPHDDRPARIGPR